MKGLSDFDHVGAVPSFQIVHSFSSLVEHHLFYRLLSDRDSLRESLRYFLDISLVSIKHNRVWCTGADLESAEWSTAPFQTVLAQLISSSEKPESLNPRQTA